jgi:hypothetical protein
MLQNDIVSHLRILSDEFETAVEERPFRAASRTLAPIKAAERRHMLAQYVSPGSVRQKRAESRRDDRNRTKKTANPCDPPH